MSDIVFLFNRQLFKHFYVFNVLIYVLCEISISIAAILVRSLEKEIYFLNYVFLGEIKVQQK